MVYSWCWLGIWVLAGPGRYGCNELLEVVCGLGDVVGLQGYEGGYVGTGVNRSDRVAF